MKRKGTRTITELLQFIKKTMSYDDKYHSEVYN